jgi:hypothetical protein
MSTRYVRFFVGRRIEPHLFAGKRTGGFVRSSAAAFN